MTTATLATELGITAKQLRVILRTFEKYADGKYTRYQLTATDRKRVMKTLEQPETETTETAE